MKSIYSSLVKSPAKASSGISGFDDITGGGLPRARTTLLVGGPGSGKTVLALQFLAHGAQDCNEPGVFVAFEETSLRIVANAESFGWNLAELQGKKKLFFMDAQPMPDQVQSGDFDLCGMLAALEVQVREMGARRIVFDALNIVLDLLLDPAAQRREIYRLHEWLLARELTAIITAKAEEDETSSINQQPFRSVLFMVDCVVLLSQRVTLGVSQRNLRVLKYRGSGFDEDEAPFLIGKNGFEVSAARTLGRMEAKVTKARVSSGVKRLDTMLAGGYYRGSSVLITGSAGTGKTTLSGTFAEAACRRGERTLFVSFDSDGSEVIRNLISVGIRLDRYLKSGCLRMISARTIAGSADTYLSRIKALAKEHGARCLVIDPVSTWAKSRNDSTAHNVAGQLIDWSKIDGITLVCTRLIEDLPNSAEGGLPLQVSTLVDTWVHLNYQVQGGERNRGLSIIKSRGTAHSNQVRELILSDAGVTLADIYTVGGDALMGTLRCEKESAERIANEITEVVGTVNRVRFDAEEAALEARVKSLQAELEAKQAEKSLLARSTVRREEEDARSRTETRKSRGTDTAKPKRK